MGDTAVLAGRATRQGQYGCMILRIAWAFLMRIMRSPADSAGRFEHRATNPAVFRVTSGVRASRVAREGLSTVEECRAQARAADGTPPAMLEDFQAA